MKFRVVEFVQDGEITATYEDGYAWTYLFSDETGKYYELAPGNEIELDENMVREKEAGE